jgi:hypothetical protein
MSGDVYAIYLEFTDRHRPQSLKRLQELSARVFAQPRPAVVAVDNARVRPREVELRHGLDVISGENSSHEFSGWDRGLEYAEAIHPLRASSVMMLANDTFARHYGLTYLGWFMPAHAEAVRRGALVGYMDAYPRPVTLFGLTVRRWIRTSLTLGTHGTLRRVRPLRLPYADEEIFSSDWRQVFRAPSPLSANYRDYLRTWVFGAPGTEFHEAWHSQESLSAASFARLKGRIRAILCEHYLSARALRAGIPLVAVNTP